MLKLNDSMNSPLRFILEDGTTIGQFYNSWDEMYHVAIYVPCGVPPSKYLCDKSGNFSPSRLDRPQRNCCPVCAAKLKELSKLSDDEFNSFGFVPLDNNG